MFKKKADVDKHVSAVLSRKRDEKERNAQGFQIARLYMEVKDYSSAKKYLAAFLSVRETVPQAHQLMGEINEALDKKEEAIENYKKALDLAGFGASNRLLVKKICELYCDLGTDVQRMKYWLDKCEALFPKSDIVYRLKERIAGAVNGHEDDNSKEVENLVVSELINQPTNITLRIKLLNIYLESGKQDEAYEAAVATDLTTAFVDHLHWFETLETIFQEYVKKFPDSESDSIYNIHLLHVLRNMTFLNMGCKEIVECTQALAKFDKQLKFATTLPIQDESWTSFVKEMKGQMFFLAGLLLLKRAKAGSIPWQEVNHLAGSCFLASRSVDPLDAQAPWFVTAPHDRNKFNNWWYLQSYDRLSQVGHMLLQLSQSDLVDWSHAVRQKTMTALGHQKVFKALFAPRDMKEQGQSSFFYQAVEMVDESGQKEPLTEQHMLEIDRVAFQVHLSNLSHLVWLCLQRYSPDMNAQPNYHFNVMENLQYSCKSMENTGAESLCQLDILVFLLATVRCAASAITENVFLYEDRSGRPTLLPVCLSKPLCTLEQGEWWTAVYKFCTNSVKDDFSKLRRILIRGIETVRLIGSHGMSISLIAHIARSLDAKIKSLKEAEFGCRCSVAELNALEVRAAFYWEKTRQALEKLKRNQHIPISKNRLFKEAGDQEVSHSLIDQLTAETTFALALVAMNRGQYEAAIEGFENHRSPWAKYHSAQIFKILAEQEEKVFSSDDTSSKKLALLQRARECLYDVLDRLNGDKSHKLNVLASRELEDIDMQLHSLEYAEDKESSTSSTFHTPSKFSLDTRQSSSTNGMVHSTPRNPAGTSAFLERDAGHKKLNTTEPVRGTRDQNVSSSSENFDRPRPSPERLDSQIRSLSYSQTSLFKVVLDRNEELIIINGKMMEELRDNNMHLKNVLSENKSLMDELKVSLTENKEMMKQIKNELGTLKASIITAPPPIPPAPPVFMPPIPASAPPRGPYPGFPAPPYGGYMINSSVPPQPPLGAGPQYRPSGLPGSRSSNVGKYRPQSEEEEEEEDDLSNIEREYFEHEQSYTQYYTPESQILQCSQDWSVGSRTGMEGQPPIPIPPLQPRMSIPAPGYFASALRGQSLQYAQNVQTPGQIKPSPGPGFFAPPAVGATGTPMIPATVAMTPVAVPTGRVPDSTSSPALLAALTGLKPSITTGAPKIDPLPPTTPAAGSLGAVLSGESRIKSLFQAKAVLESKKAKGDITILVDTHNNRATILMMSETKEILFHHDINAMKVEPSFLATTVIWTGTKVGSVEREKITVNLDSSSLASQLKEAIQKATALIQVKESALAVTTAATNTTVTPLKVVSQAGNQDAAKSVFGGFTFTTTPAITPVADKPKVDAPVATPAKDDKPKPFAGFTLTPSSKPDVKFSLADSTDTTKSVGKISTPITKQTPGGRPSPKVEAKSPGGGDDDHVEEYEPNVEFKPVIALPELVDKKTGEENETEIFVERCRLFRFDPEVKQWKERGVGEMKILKSKDQIKFRIIMRRDQILKLCANHFLNSEMRLTPMASSDRAWCYSAMDFSEEEMKAEQLAVKFKTSEKASSFQVVFDDCCSQLKEEKKKLNESGETGKEKSDVVDTGSERVSGKAESSTSGTKSLSEMFKPKPGSWECQGCYIRNNDDVPKCPACNTVKPGGTTAAPSGSAPPAGSASTSTTKSLSEMFKPKIGSWECDGCLVRNNEDVIKCPACGTLKPGAKASDAAKTGSASSSFVAGVAAGPAGTGFKFGAASNVMPTTGGFSFTSPASSAAPSSGFKFGMPVTTAQTTSTVTEPAGGFKFGTPSTSAKTTSTTSAPTGGFKFGTPGTSAPTTTTITPTGGFKLSTPTSSAQTTNSTFAPPGGFKFGVPVTSGQSTTTTTPPSGFFFGVPTSVVTTTATTTPTGGFTFANPTTSAPTASSTTPASGFSFKTPTSGIVQAADSTSVIKPPFGAFSTKATTAASGFSFGTTTATNIFATPATSTTSSSSNILATPATFPATTQGFSLDSTPKPGSFLFTSTPIVSKDTAKQAGTSGLLAKLLTSDDTSSETPGKPQAGFNFTMPNKSVASADSTSSNKPGFQFSFTKSPVKVQQSPVVPSSPEVDEHGMYVNKEGDDSHIHFEPIVVLPDKVEVKTGEEEENILFEARGKMYRFVSSEWKEKGVGVVKILEHKETKKTRVLMRRDQVLKICCNHKIEPTLNLQPMAKSEGKAWVWYALDFTENEGRMEQLALRFRTQDIANEFKNVFEKCQSKSSPAKTASDEHVPQRQVKKELFEDDDVIFVGEEKPTPEQIAKARQYLLPDAFYLYEKKPACPGCLGCNDGEMPLNVPVSKTTTSTKKLKESHKTEKPDQPIFGNAGNLPDFASLTSDTPSEKDSSSFVFGSKTSVDFSSLASNANAQDFTWKKSESSMPFKFAGAGQRLFGAGGAGAADGGNEGEDGDDSGVTPSDDIHFEPVIPLPDLVEVKTGEEDWKPLFCQRAKLYKFDTNLSQWKERAIGEMKITSHNTKTMFRILQRREQVLKVACNHLISVDMDLKPMATSETAWCWIATDYTDTEPSVDQFAVKFKNKDIATEFKDIFQECQKKLALPVPALAASENVSGGVGGTLIFETGISVASNKVAISEISQQENKRDSNENVKDNTQDEIATVSCAPLGSKFEAVNVTPLGDKGNRHHTKALDVTGQDDIVPASYAPLGAKLSHEKMHEACVNVPSAHGKQTQLNQITKQQMESSMGNTSHTQILTVLGEDNVHKSQLESVLNSDPGRRPESYEQEGDANDEEEGCEEDEEEEDKVLFEKRATLSSFENGQWKKLGLGTLFVTYNDDLNGNSLHFASDSGMKLCSHVICREHTITLDRSRQSCEWKPIDYSTDEPIRKHFSAAFSSISAAEEFVNLFSESQRLAVDSEISENMPSDIEVPEIFSTGELNH